MSFDVDAPAPQEDEETIARREAAETAADSEFVRSVGSILAARTSEVAARYGAQNAPMRPPSATPRPGFRRPDFSAPGARDPV